MVPVPGVPIRFDPAGTGAAPSGTGGSCFGWTLPVPGRSPPGWTLPVPLRLLPVPGGATRARSGRDSAPPVPGGAAELGEGLCRYRGCAGTGAVPVPEPQPLAARWHRAGGHGRGGIRDPGLDPPNRRVPGPNPGLRQRRGFPAGKTNTGKRRSSPVTRGDLEGSARARAGNSPGKRSPGRVEGTPGLAGPAPSAPSRGFPLIPAFSPLSGAGLGSGSGFIAAAAGSCPGPGSPLAVFGAAGFPPLGFPGILPRSWDPLEFLKIPNI